MAHYGRQTSMQLLIPRRSATLLTTKRDPCEKCVSIIASNRPPDSTLQAAWGRSSTAAAASIGIFVVMAAQTATKTSRRRRSLSIRL